jgi:hypothetical protein
MQAYFHAMLAGSCCNDEPALMQDNRLALSSPVRGSGMSSNLISMAETTELLGAAKPR